MVFRRAGALPRCTNTFFKRRLALLLTWIHRLVLMALTAAARKNAVLYNGPTLHSTVDNLRHARGFQDRADVLVLYVVAMRYGAGSLRSMLIPP